MATNQTAALSILTKKYQKLLKRQKKYWLIALIIAVPNFMIAPFFLSKIFHIHWLISLLFIPLLGSWSTLFSQIISSTLFLSEKIKYFPHIVMKKNPPYDFLIRFWKALKRKIMAFSVMSGALLFWIFLVLWQKPNNDGTSKTILVDDVIGVFFFCFFLSALTFKISKLITDRFLKIERYPKHNDLSSWEDFEEVRSTSNKVSPDEKNEFHSINKILCHWDHDPMNPASAEYQSTFRRWNHEI